MPTIEPGTSTAPRAIRASRGTHPAGLQPSTYDRAAGLLLAGLLILGCAVSLMFLLWISSRTWLPKPAVALPVHRLNQEVGGGGIGPGIGDEATDRNFEEPAASELTELAVTPATGILEAVSIEEAARLVEADLTINVPTKALGSKPGPGRGPGNGPGDGPGDYIGTPPWERWEVQLSANTLAEYKQQLDFFEIELGVAGGGSPVVTYISNVSKTSQVRTGNPQDEQRLRFLHRSGALRNADKQIVSAAGVDTGGKVIFQFYSQKTYDTLLTLENIAMRPRHIGQVRRTVFGVRGGPGSYEFYVISQDYRS